MKGNVFPHSAQVISMSGMGSLHEWDRGLATLSSGREQILVPFLMAFNPRGLAGVLTLELSPTVLAFRNGLLGLSLLHQNVRYNVLMWTHSTWTRARLVKGLRRNLLRGRDGVIIAPKRAQPSRGYELEYVPHDCYVFTGASWLKSSFHIVATIAPISPPR